MATDRFTQADFHLRDFTYMNDLTEQRLTKDFGIAVARLLGGRNAFNCSLRLARPSSAIRH